MKETIIISDERSFDSHMQFDALHVLKSSHFILGWDSESNLVLWKHESKAKSIFSREPLIAVNGFVITAMVSKNKNLEVVAYHPHTGTPAWSRKVDLNLASNYVCYTCANGQIFLKGSNKEGRFRFVILESGKGKVVSNYAGRSGADLFSHEGKVFMNSVDGIFEIGQTQFQQVNSTETYSALATSRGCLLVYHDAEAKNTCLGTFDTTTYTIERITELPDDRDSNWILGEVGDGRVWMRNDDKAYPMLIDLRESPAKYLKLEDVDMVWIKKAGDSHYMKGWDNDFSKVSLDGTWNPQYLPEVKYLRDIAATSKNRLIVGSMRGIAIWETE